MHWAAYFINHFITSMFTVDCIFYIICINLGPSIFVDMIIVEQVSTSIISAARVDSSILPYPTSLPTSAPSEVPTIVPKQCKPTKKQRHAAEVMHNFEQTHHSLLDLHDKKGEAPIPNHIFNPYPTPR